MDSDAQPISYDNFLRFDSPACCSLRGQHLSGQFAINEQHNFSCQSSPKFNSMPMILASSYAGVAFNLTKTHTVTVVSKETGDSDTDSVLEWRQKS